MLGYLSFTEITDPSAHRAYNEWHQLDHLPQQFALDGVAFGQRWVRSPDCRSLEVGTGTRLHPCHYLTMYLLRDQAAVPPFLELARTLRQRDRFFQVRKAHLSGPFAITGQWAAPRVKVSPDVVPFRPSNGIYLVVRSGGAPLITALEAAAEGQDVAGIWEFEDSSEVKVTVAFVDGDLPRAGTALGRACLGQHPGGVGLDWAGPLERVDANRWNWFDRLTPP